VSLAHDTEPAPAYSDTMPCAAPDDTTLLPPPPEEHFDRFESDRVAYSLGWIG
jgi:hypothetical protein